MPTWSVSQLAHQANSYVFPCSEFRGIARRGKRIFKPTSEALITTRKGKARLGLLRAAMIVQSNGIRFRKNEEPSLPLTTK